MLSHRRTKTMLALSLAVGALGLSILAFSGVAARRHTTLR
jgi:hypothetical protein